MKKNLNALIEDFLKLLKASGVVVEQKPGSPTTLAFYSRWSQKEIQKTI